MTKNFVFHKTEIEDLRLIDPFTSDDGSVKFDMKK